MTRTAQSVKLLQYKLTVFFFSRENTDERDESMAFLKSVVDSLSQAIFLLLAQWVKSLIYSCLKLSSNYLAENVSLSAKSFLSVGVGTCLI